jgi:hypothetical protein
MGEGMAFVRLAREIRRVKCEMILSFILRVRFVIQIVGSNCHPNSDSDFDSNYGSDCDSNCGSVLIF